MGLRPELAWTWKIKGVKQWELYCWAEPSRDRLKRGNKPSPLTPRALWERKEWMMAEKPKDELVNVDPKRGDVKDGLSVLSGSVGGFGRWYVIHVASGKVIGFPGFHNDPTYGFSTYLVAYAVRGKLLDIRDWNVDQPIVTKEEFKKIESAGLAGYDIEDHFLEDLSDRLGTSFTEKAVNGDG